VHEIPEGEGEGIDNGPSIDCQMKEGKRGDLYRENIREYLKGNV
jgi:hypothetical protein